MLAFIVSRISAQGLLNMHVYEVKDVKIDIKSNTKLINQVTAERDLMNHCHLKVWRRKEVFTL